METGRDKSIASKQCIILDLPPSCIEFCPSHPAYFVVGTYNLIKDDKQTTEMTETERTDSPASQKPQNRNGSLMVFRYEDGAIHHVQTVPHPSAILDLHFCPLPGKHDILAVVSSTGTLAIFQLDPEAGDAEPLKELATSRISDVSEDVLFLSGVWSLKEPASVGITTSTGEVRIVRLDGGWNIIGDDADAVISHTLEAWTVAFSPDDDDGKGTNEADHKPFIVFSGGDDSALRYASCVEGDDPVSAQYPPLKIDCHDAGVTAILPIATRLADGSRILVTGSYDDTIRVLAVQPPHETYGMRKFKRLAEMNLGGGVWRLKLINVQESTGTCRIRVLASCMHAGARVVELLGPLDGGDWDVRVLAQFEEHKSMNYGGDFVPGSGDGRLICASTSFYDKLLCLWEVELR
ncbi:Diphthine methyltransferase [Colletotrichum musicola]|uniref:methylated diphthine methylhydrolase n=1 Tax=Colletotrichum musicola TaxID=2175873 RepID=A0A8H6MJV4_9PEZI|nr:Diphthine methyltransferase [Colletotrichum musicola]